MRVGRVSLSLLGEVSLNPVCGDTLGAFDGVTQSTIPDETGQDTQSTRNTEQNGVELGFNQAVMLEKDTTVGINLEKRER
jgi:hypothetical protein